MNRNRREKIYTKISGKFVQAMVWMLAVFFYAQIFSAHVYADQKDNLQSQTVLFNNFPRVALLVKEQYVEPERINPDVMLASIMQKLQEMITKLVVTLPPTLEKALENSKGKKVEPLSQEVANEAPIVPSLSPVDDIKAVKPVAEKLIFDLGGVKKVFDYEPQRSIWGMIFTLRDIFKFLELESKKQDLAELTKAGKQPIDWEKIEYGSINAMLGTLDPHSIFLEPKYARDLTLTTKGKFGGVGIVISVRDGFLTVISPIEGTPAAIAGVKAKDRIIKIDDDSAINMDLNDAVNLLRGQEETDVRITVQRNATSEMEFKLKRKEIKVESVAHAMLPKNIGYVRIKAFQGNTADDVKNAILSMKKESAGKMGGVILDLRDNPGGLLREAVAISDLFLDGGEVVSTQGPRKESRQVEMASSGQMDEKLRIAVLVNGGSASASEIVASAIKNGGLDGGRGIVVGERTFGKGSVQLLFDFPTLDTKEPPKNQKDAVVQPAALKLTIAQYFGPKDTPVQETGVLPDIVLTQVRAEKAQDLSLFENTSMREVDLDSHLVGAKAREEKAVLKLDFLAPKADEETTEYSKLDTKALGNDFAVKVGSAFISAAKGPKRSQILENVEKIGKMFSKEEERKIVNALKTHNIDWSMGKGALNKDALKISIVENKGAIAGEKLKVSFKVKNVSNSTIHQVYGITNSKTPLFSQRELLFGKLAPGKEIIRTIEFEIPQDVISRKDLMKVEFKDSAKMAINALNVPLEIKGLERPQFAHMIYVDDSKSGNGDGKVQKGENVELVAWIKNIGKGKAFEPTVLLRNESGSKVFLKTGREQGKELLPNQESSVRFSFSVKEPTDKAEFEVQIFDGKFRDIWRDKISIDVKPETVATKPIDKVVEVSKKNEELYAFPDATSQVIARLVPQVPFKAIKEVGEFLAIMASDNLVGYIKKSQVVDSKLELDKHKGQGFAVNYDRIPALVQLKFGDGKGFSTKDSGNVHANITGANKVADVLMFVNGQKVLYHSLAGAKNTEKIEHKINLKPGVNIITLLANEDSTYGQRENITVFFDDTGKLWPEVHAKPVPLSNVQ